MLEAIQAGNVAGILRGEKRYRIEPPTSVPDVFPTDVCQVLTEYFYKQNDIDKIQDILEGSLIELSQSSAVDLYISVLFFDTILFMQEKNSDRSRCFYLPIRLQLHKQSLRELRIFKRN